MKKVNKETKFSVKRNLFLSANFFFTLIIIGFFLTTNIDNPSILGKYTSSYLTKLFMFTFLIIPYNLVLLFFLNDSIIISTDKKKYKINRFSRLIIVFFFILVILLLLELFLRMKPKPYIENFHPYLQAIHTRENDSNLHINSDNFRYDELTENKPDNIYRIFIVGGSTVLDKDRSYEKNLVKQIENMLQDYYPNKKIQVINAGYERYTSQHSLILYETKISDFNPDLIVVWQGFNDLYYSCMSDFIPIKKYRNDYSHFYEVLTNVTNSYFNYDLKLISVERLKKAFFENFYADIRKNFIKTEPKMEYVEMDSFPSLNAYIRNVNYMIKLAKADNVKIILGNQPNNYLDDPKAYVLAQFYCKKGTINVSLKSIRTAMNKFNESSRKIALEQNIPFIDIESRVPKTWEYFTDDVHYTDKGSKRVAEVVFESIVDSSYLDN